MEMNRLSGRPADDEIERIVTTYEPGLFRLCLMMLGREMDAEDAVSETMIRYIGKAPDFHDSGHERAWLYTVAANVCRDMLRRRRKTVSLDQVELTIYAREPEDRPILEALSRLPEEYRTVLYLHYVEGYKSHEIGAMLGVSSGTVRKRLQYARRLLKLEYEQE